MTAPLRVLQLVDGLTTGGAENLLPTLGLALREQGLEVEFAALFERARSPVVDRLEAAGFVPRVLGLEGLRPAGYRRVAELLRDRRPDLLHAHLPYAATLGVLAAWRRVPSVVTLHQMATLRQRAQETVKEALFRLVVGALATRVVAVSGAVARYYGRRGLPGGKLRVVPNAIDLRPFEAALGESERARLLAELDLPPGARIVVCVSMLRIRKGLELLLRTLPAIRAQVPESVLLLVGEGEERERLVAEAARLGLGRGVRFLGLRQDVARLLQLAEVNVLPTEGEALPTVLIEACAAGTPSVASEVGGVPEVVRHRQEGLLTPLGDGPALAGAVVELLRDESLRRRLGLAAHERAERFRPERWARELVELYRQIARPAWAGGPDNGAPGRLLPWAGGR